MTSTRGTATLETLELEAAASFDEIVRSFMSPKIASTLMRILQRRWTFLIVTLVVQAVLALRLRNTAFADEALYINDGHRLWAHAMHGTPVFHSPGLYFSGAPALYPVLAAGLDDLGGLFLARLFSVACMGIATSMVYLTTSKLFGARAAKFGTVMFAGAGPVLFLTNFATYDAPSLAALAVAVYCAVRASAKAWWSIPVGLMLAVAGMTKYAAFIFAPCVVLLMVLLAWPQAKSRALSTALVSITVLVTAVWWPALRWGKSVIYGLEHTTLHRVPTVRTSTLDLVGDGLRWVAPQLILAALGAGLLVHATRRWALALTLIASTVIADVYQIYLHERVSFHKHVAFGLIFGCVLIGYALDHLWARRRDLRAVAVVGAALLSILAFGVGVSAQLYSGWPSSDPVARVMSQRLATHPPTEHYLLADPDAAIEQYRFEHTVPSTQWDTTAWMSYKGKLMLPAYSQALHDHYFAVVILNTIEPISDQLTPVLQETGYHLRSSISQGRFLPDYWRVWTHD